MHRWGARALLASVLLTVAACGSTVEGGTAPSGLVATGGAPATGGGLSLPSAPGSAVGAGNGGVSTGASGANPSGATASSQAGTVAASGQSGGVGATGPAAATGPGVTASTIYIGVEYCSSCGAGDRVIGAAGAAPSYDYRNVFDAAASYANAHGGFAGRKLQAIYYNYNTTTDIGTQDQAACANWTQDHKVFAIFAAQQTDEALRTCAERAGAVSIATGGAELGSTFQREPHYVDITGLGLDQLATVTVNGLVNAHYFTGKLGLVTWDDPTYHYAIDHGYLPDLAAHHIAVAQTAYIAVPQQINAISDTSAAVSSAVTKFRTLGIDHVIVQDGQAGIFGGAGLTLEWMDQAKSQSYYPRYGQNANNTPGWSVLPSDEMNLALAVDQTDLDPSRDAGWHLNAARERCYQIEAAAGYPVSNSNLNDQIAAGASCDTVFLLQRLLNKTSSVTANAFIAGVGALGTSFQSAEVYGTKFTPAIHGGGGMVRTEEYFASCQCLRYQGAPYFAD